MTVRAMRLGVASLLLLLIAGSLLAGCGGAPEYTGPPILVVAMDGLEWQVLEPLVEQGRAPNFAALIAGGVAGELGTASPTLSPVIWTSIATGAFPAQHGIRYFSETNERGEPLADGLPYTSNCRRVPAVWNVAADHGREVLAVGWWVSWPAERLENGRVVASYAAQAQGQILWQPGVGERGLPEHTWPPDLIEEILPALRDGRPGGPLDADYHAIFGTVPPQWKFEAHVEPVFRSVYHADRTHLRIMREQLAQHPADMNLVYFGLPDVAGHLYWRFHEPGAFDFTLPPRRIERLGKRVEAAYEQADAFLGELLAAMPQQRLVMVLSDHGMHAVADATVTSIQTGGHADAPPGVLIVAGPGVTSRGLLPPAERELGSVYDVMPTLLDWLELGRPKGLAGRPLRHLMTEAWRSQHPEPAAQDYRAGFRAATPPRVPVENADRIFLNTFLDDIGYAGSLEDEAPRR